MITHNINNRLFYIREIQQKDNLDMAEVIRTVMPEFGATGDGFAIVDPQVDHLYEAYNDRHSIYYVIEYNGQIVGGAGIAPLEGAASSICELQKMYFLASARGLGLGDKLISLCLQFAKEHNYQSCYIETLTGMDGAKKLYLKNGFQPIDAPMGNTGHFKCDQWYQLKLND